MTRRLLIVTGVMLASLFALLGGTAGARVKHLNYFKVETSTTQAGGHPDVTLLSEMDTWINEGYDPEHPYEFPYAPIEVPEGYVFGEPIPGINGNEDARTIVQDYPTGFIGNPHAIPTCSLAELGQKECPVEAQVGVVNIVVESIILGPITLQSALYNVEPHPNEPGLVAFTIPLVQGTQFISIAGRTESDYGLQATVSPIFHESPLLKVDTYLWGVPADPVHDIHRFPSPLPASAGGGCLSRYPESCFTTPSDAPLVPYLQNPTTCGQELSARMKVEWYDQQVDSKESAWPRTTGCDQLSFNPSIAVHPTTEAASTASGLDLVLRAPQPQSPTVPSPSELRSATVTLPEGFTVNANAADGKTACTDAEAGFGTREAAQCPETSKIGTVTIDSSALPGPIDGAIYLGVPRPGNRYRIFFAADGFGTHVKVSGSLHMDPRTGQVSASFDELPQSPLQEFDMHIFGSERGVLATPTKCGSYPVEAKFVPWDGALPTQDATTFFTIDSGPSGTPCPGSVRPFDPQLVAGSARNTAGAHTDFSLKVNRTDDQQDFSSLAVKTPPGFSATLAGTPYCPDSSLARLSEPTYSGIVEQLAPLCPQASQVGTVTTTSGVGSRPLYSNGKVFLAGPYRGAPLSLAVVIPAVSGPYDLGNVVVRNAIEVDPTTAQVTTRSDPIPSIVEGIPLRVKGIQVNLNKPNFALNPTNCEPSTIDARLEGDEGAVADRGSQFQVANCAALPYGPKLNLTLTGGLRRRGHPTIHASLATSPGEANSRMVTVTLPKGELLDNAHIENICTRVQFSQGACPPSSVLGTAEASTPLLAQPLTGIAYLRSSSHRLPDLAIALKGQVDFDLVGRIDSLQGRLRTTFEGLPDVPVSSFTLTLMGGSKGLLQNSETLCGTKRKSAGVRMAGQNGMVDDSNVRLRALCGKQPRRKRPSRHTRKVG
jgi:hypothetical protein